MPKKPTTAQPAWAPVVALLKKDAPVDEIRKALLAAVPAGLPAAANPNRSGETLLHYAARAHRVDVLRLLVEEFSGNVNAANNHGRQAIHEGIDDLDTTNYLLSAGADQNSMKRASKGNIPVIKALIRAGADMRQVNKDGWTALHLATRNRQADAVKYFLSLDSQAWKNRTNSGRLPLHTAASSGFSELVHLFVSRCPSPDRGGLFGIDNGGMGTVHYACAGGDDVDAVKECFEAWKEEAAAAQDPAGPRAAPAAADGFVDPAAHPDPWDLPDSNGRRPLHCAAMMGNARVVRYLVAECGAAVDAGDAWDSWTPVFFAAKEGRAEVAKILLEARCDIRRKDRLGRTPLDLAKLWNREELINILGS